MGAIGTKPISRRTAVKMALVGACAMALPVSLPKPAFATTKWSAFKSETWDSPSGWLKISARNGVDSVNLKGVAYTQITTDKTVPAGKLNAVAKLTNGAGLIIGSTKLAKNTSQAKSVTAKATGKGSGYSSRGWAFCCYSSGCRYIYPAWPSISPKSTPHYATNENGQTYGCITEAPSAACLPDLIAVMSDDGKAGYSYRDEICPMPKTAEEVIEMEKIEHVDVYASDGTTVIGVHTLQ